MCASAIPFFAAILFTAAPSDCDKRDGEKFQGTWKVTAAERDGLPHETIKGDTLTIQNEGFTIKTKEGEMKGTLKFAAGKSFTAVDFTHTEGSSKGKTMLAIAEVSGDECKICFAPPDAKERPAEFTGKAGSKSFLVTLKREKP
jgi:uncharacterized protein (TIGR03067 family)